MIRKILDNIFASPIIAVSSIVIITCVTVLTNSFISDSSDNSTNRGIPASVSELPASKVIQQGVNQPDFETNMTDTGVNNTAVNDSDRYQVTPDNSKRPGGQSTRRYGNTNNKTGNFNDNKNYQTNINYPSEHFDDSYSNIADGATDNSKSSPQININTSLDASGVTRATNDIANTTNDVTNKANNLTGATNTAGDTTQSDTVYEATIEQTVQVDLDETQSISCRRIVENGPPCMCTLTITDASGTVVEEMNNCAN